MSSGDLRVDRALNDLDQAIGNRNANDRASINAIEGEIDAILANLQQCAAAVASGSVSAAQYQHLLDRLNAMIPLINNSPVNQDARTRVLARLRDAVGRGDIRRNNGVAPYGPVLSSSPAPGAGPASAPGAGSSSAPGAGPASGWRGIFGLSSSSSDSPSSSPPSSASPSGPSSSDIELRAPKGVGKEGTLLRPPSSGLNPLLSPPALGPAKPLFNDDDDDEDDYHGPAIRPDDVPKSSAFDDVSAAVQKRKHDRDLFANRGTAIGGKKSKRNKKYRKKTRR